MGITTTVTATAGTCCGGRGCVDDCANRVPTEPAADRFDGFQVPVGTEVETEAAAARLDGAVGGAGGAVRLGSPAEVAAAIPHFFGFHPDASIVVLGLNRSDQDGRAAISHGLRVDLSSATQNPASFGRWMAGRLLETGANEALCVLYPPEGGPARMSDYRRMVAGMCAPLRMAGVAPLDVLFVADSRWWSFLCDRATCCPPEGSPVDAGASAIAALSAYSGLAVLPNRATLAAGLAPYGPDMADRMRAACDTALNRIAANHLAPDTAPSPNPDTNPSPNSRARTTPAPTLDSRTNPAPTLDSRTGTDSSPRTSLAPGTTPNPGTIRASAFTRMSKPIPPSAPTLDFTAVPTSPAGFAPGFPSALTPALTPGVAGRVPAPEPGDVTTSPDAAPDAALDSDLDFDLGSDPRVLDFDWPDVARAWQLADSLCDGQVPPDRALTDEAAGELLVALADVRVRDYLATWCGDDRAGQAVALSVELARRSVASEQAAAAYAIAAWAAWALGWGAWSRLCLERAVSAVPGYALAGLIKQGLERGVGPELVREAARGTARRLDEMYAEYLDSRTQDAPRGTARGLDETHAEYLDSRTQDAPRGTARRRDEMHAEHLDSRAQDAPRPPKGL